MIEYPADSLLWQAISDALPALAHDDRSSARDLVQQWGGVAAYAAQRGQDHLADRIAVLREILDEPETESAENVAAHACQAIVQWMRDGVGGDRAAQVHDACLTWFEADQVTASPLLGVFTGHGADPSEEPQSLDPMMVTHLEKWFADKLNSPSTIKRALIISGGFSRLMVDVQLQTPTESREYIVRIEQGGMFATESRREVAIMQAMQRTDYPVPAVPFAEFDGSILGEPFFVMDKVKGAARLDDEGLNDVLRSTAELHRIDPIVLDGADGIDARVSPEEMIQRNIDGWLEVYRAHSRVRDPLIEGAAEWLRGNLKPTGPLVIVHGDPGPGNALHDGTGIAAVIDWEFAHLGDAAEDWAYLALIRGRRIMDRPAWKQRLTDVVGVSYDEETWRMWEAYNHFKGTCVNMTALTVFSNGPRRTPDQLAIGIAVHMRFLGQLLALRAN